MKINNKNKINNKKTIEDDFKNIMASYPNILFFIEIFFIQN